MSKVIAVLILVAAVAVGASAGLVLSKPAPKPQQAAQLQQTQPKPQQAVGSCPVCPLPPGATMAQVYAGCIPTGPGVPPALAGRCWIGAGGNLGPWWEFNPITQKMVKKFDAASTPVPANQIFPGTFPYGTIWYLPDPSPTGPVYFTLGSPDTE